MQPRAGEDPGNRLQLHERGKLSLPEVVDSSILNVGTQESGKLRNSVH